MLRINNLCFSYGKKKVLEDVSLRVRKGELCGLFGPNGCGKTTLFKCCLKFLSVASGSIFMDQRDLQSLAIGETARLAAYVPQEHSPPFPYLVKEIVLMGRTPHIRNSFGIGARDKEKALEALFQLGIEHLADHPYNRLSSGQRQMVLIARAVAQETKTMFLDEPTSALDYKNQIRIWREMRKVVENGTTVLVCTHDPNHVSWFCDKVLVMQSGKIAAEGLPGEVMNQELLDSIYQDICMVRRTGDVKLVLPKEVGERSALKDE